MSQGLYSTETLCTALKLLIRKPELPTTIDDQLKENVIEAARLLNLKYCNIHKLLPDLDNRTDDTIRWKFVTLCFYVLLSLRYEEDFINVNLLKYIRHTFYMIVSIGVINNLSSNIVIPPMKRKEYLQISSDATKPEVIYHRLTACTRGLLKCMDSVLLRSCILQKYLGDLLIALFELSFAAVKKPNSDDVNATLLYNEANSSQLHFKEEFKKLMWTVYRSHIFRELMILYGYNRSNKWCERPLLKILNKLISSSGGVISLIRAITQPFVEDTSSEWMKYDIIVKLLLRKPSCNAEKYFKSVNSQMRELLKAEDRSGRPVRAFEQILALYIKRLYVENEAECLRHLIQPFFIESFTQYGKQADVEVHTKIITSDIIATISAMHNCFVVPFNNERLLAISMLTPVVKILYHLYITIHDSILHNTKHELSALLNKYIKETCTTNEEIVFSSFLFDAEVENIIDLKENVEFTLVNDKCDIQITNLNRQNKADLFKNSKYFVHLLEISPNHIANLQLFKYLLHIVINTYTSNNNEPDQGPSDINAAAVRNKNIERKLIAYQLLSVLSSNKSFVDVFVKQDSKDIVKFIENTLHAIVNSNKHQHGNYDVDDTQVICILILIINEIISRIPTLFHEYRLLNTCLTIIKDESNCTELKTLIDTCFTLNNENREPRSEFEEVMIDITDPLIPVRGHALITLAKLIENRNPEVYSRKIYIFHLCLEHLKSEDSYIYLNAIKVLTALGRRFPKVTLNILCEEYATLSKEMFPDNKNRLKLGEVIMQTVKNLDEVRSYKSVLLNTFFSCVRDDDHLIRASSYSILGEICHALGANIGSSINHVLKSFHEGMNDDAVEVRRASVTVIRQLFLGLKRETVFYLKENLLSIFRTLNDIYTNDPDDTIKLQAQLALEELNEIL